MSRKAAGPLLGGAPEIQGLSLGASDDHAVLCSLAAAFKDLI